MSEFEEALRVSKQLRLQADRLHVIISAPTNVLPAERLRDLLWSELREMQEQVLRHFASEEEGGYLAGVLERRPELSSRVQELKAQHAALRAELEQLLMAVRSQTRLNEVVQSIEALLDDFDGHEHAETRILQEAYETDGGSGD